MNAAKPPPASPQKALRSSVPYKIFPRHRSHLHRQLRQPLHPPPAPWAGRSALTRPILTQTDIGTLRASVSRSAWLSEPGSRSFVTSAPARRMPAQSKARPTKPSYRLESQSCERPLSCSSIHPHCISVKFCYPRGQLARGPRSLQSASIDSRTVFFGG